MAKNFSEQISDVKVTLNRLNQVKKSDCKTGSFFKDSLLKWSELNFRKDFIDYVAEVREISETLPQILLHQDVLVQSLLKRFTFEYKNSVEALFDLLEALSRDVGKEFIKYFPETLIKFECLITKALGMNLRFLNNYLLALHACASYFMKNYLVIFREHCKLPRI